MSTALTADTPAAQATPWREARTLLSPRRFDVIAKSLYARWRLRGLKSEWYRQLYLDHIAVLNGFFEADGSGKHGEAGFLTAFDALIDDIAAHGFNADRSRVPLADTGEILNGAHRLAAALAAGTEVAIETQSDQIAYAYDHRWFQRRGLSLPWADAIASEACRLLPGSFVVVVYPSASGRDDELEDLIAAYSRIWYRKSIQLSDNGALNLVQQIYRRERWVGGPHNDYKGARAKQSGCFARPGPVRAYLVESELESIRRLKSDIRALFKVDNHSVHINDTHGEARELAGMLFNENSVSFLNARQRRALPWFDALFTAYAQELARSTADDDDFCIDSSGVLAAYGLRDVRDLDFLHDVRAANAIPDAPKVSAHNAEAGWYGLSPDEIVHNPLQHFYFNGVKFARIGLIREMKSRRAEAKDIGDIALIENAATAFPLESTSSPFTPARALSWPGFYQRARFLKLRLRLLWHSLGRGSRRRNGSA